MKIIFCLHHFLPEYVAGTEIYTLRLAQTLQNNGVETRVVVPGFDTKEDVEYMYEGVHVIRYVENSVEDREMIMGKKEPEGLQRFADILIREKPGLVHFHELAPGRGINSFHVEKARGLQIPVVLTFHLAYYTCIKNSLYYKNIKRCDGLIREKACTECVLVEKGLSKLKTNLLTNTAMALYRSGINTTVFNNSIGTGLGFPFVINNLRKNLLRLSALADRVVVIAGWYKEMLEKNGVPSSKIELITQGLTTEYSGSQGHKIPGSSLKVMYIGRITESKGLHLLIDACNLLEEDVIDLHIYGQETTSAYAAECKEKARLKKNIYWHGVIPSKDVIPTLSEHDILCLPSVFSEMSPLVIQEAFAAGIPVLASDVYGNLEQVEDGVNGWLFRFNDSMDLFTKLNCIINNKEIIQKATQNLPPVRFFKEVGKKYLELFNEIISNRKVTGRTEFAETE